MTRWGRLKMRVTDPPRRWLTRAATWWLSPQKPPRTIVCPRCGNSVTTWRTYSGGRQECVPCASLPSGRRK